MEPLVIQSLGYDLALPQGITELPCLQGHHFASENDLELYLKSRDEIMTSELYDRLAAAGLKRQVVSKVWNKDQFRISVIFEYSSKDAFEKCRTIFGELERSEFMNKFAVKFQNNRGVVISEFEA